MNFHLPIYAGNIAVAVVTVLTATELQCHLWFLPSSLKLKSVFYQDEPYIPKCICYIHSPRFRKYFASKDSFLSHLQGHTYVKIFLYLCLGEPIPEPNGP